MVCQKCGHSNSSTARFCVGCGAQLGVVISNEHQLTPQNVVITNPQNSQDQENYYGLITGINRNNGSGFIDHPKAPRGVYFHRNVTREFLDEGDVVVFQVDDWNKDPRPTVRNIRKACSISYGVVQAWNWNYGTILPERGSEPVHVDLRSARISPKDKKVLRSGDTVSYNVLPDKPQQVIFVRRDYALRRFAQLGNEMKMLQDLKLQALDEKWEYPGSKPLKMLFNYLFYTFARLQEEDQQLDQVEKKIRIARRMNQLNIAVFDTGLVNQWYKEIYAVFMEEKDAPIGQPGWRLIGFCARGDRINGVSYLTSFRELPGRAEYFEDPRDLLYDPNLRLDLRTRHVVGDRAHRLPMTVKQRIPPSLKDEDEIIEFLDRHLNQAIERAQDRIRWNYKTAIPQYYPGTKRIQLLLPLCLDDPRKVDVALAVQREEEAYMGYTILELDWAYSNARLIARPDSDWLAVEALQDKGDADMPED